MSRFLRAGLPLAFCAVAAACSNTAPAPVAAPPPAPPPAAPAPAAPPTAFDGIYTGKFVRTAESPASCRATHGGTIRIYNGGFSFQASRSQSFKNVALNPDGSFTATTGDTTFHGAVANGALTGALDGSKCHYTVNLTGRPLSRKPQAS